MCLKAAGGRTLVNGATLGAGSRTNAYRSSRFDLTLGNGNARMRVNGKLLDVPDVQSGIGYRITPQGPAHAVAGRAADLRMSARAGIVVTGTEVLTGRVVDRNGPWLADRLLELGVELAHNVDRGGQAVRRRGGAGLARLRTAST